METGMDKKSEEQIHPKDVKGKVLRKVLQDRYDIGKMKITQLRGGTESTGWLVETEQSKWIAKLYGPQEQPLERVKDEARFYRYLNEHGIYAPIMRTTRDGNDISTAIYRGIAFPLMLMRHENLRMSMPSTITKAELTKIAKETARLHQISRAYPNARNIPTWPEKEALKGKDITAFEAFAQSVNSNNFTAEQLAHFEKTDEQMEQYIKNHPPAESLTETVIHGDLGLEHAQFLPDGSVYFFDFADRRWDTLAQELGTFITMLYQWEDISFERLEQLREWLIEGYQQTNPLSKDDMSAIPQKALIRILGATKYLSILAKDTYNEHVVNWVRRGYELGDYITSQAN